MSERLDVGGYRPTGEFVWRQPVRAYEPGANGRLGPGNLLRYCEWVANAASAAAGAGPRWYQDRGEGWVIYRKARKAPSFQAGDISAVAAATLVLFPCTSVQIVLQYEYA